MAHRTPTQAAQKAKERVLNAALGKGSKPPLSTVFSRDPWERQDGERDKGWASFVMYRDMGAGKRSVAKVAELIQAKPESLSTYARMWRWPERAAAWDRELDRIAREAEISALQEMKKRHINIALLQQRAGVREISKIDKKSEENPDAVILEPKEALDLIDRGVKGERLARGEPDTVTEQRHELTVGDRRTRLRSALDRSESHALIEQLSDMFLDESLDQEEAPADDDSIIDATLDDDER